jgi:hypothetical protein
MTCPTTPLTDEQKARICGVLTIGCDWQTAADLVGCTFAEIRRAMQADAGFAVSVRRAEARAELAHMRTVQDAAKEAKNWRASVWWMERHAPDRYGPRGAGEITARQLKAFTALMADILAGDASSPDSRQQLLARLSQLNDSVAQLLREEQPPESEAFALPAPQSTTTATDSSDGFDDSSDEVDDASP